METSPTFFAWKIRFTNSFGKGVFGFRSFSHSFNNLSLNSNVRGDMEPGLRLPNFNCG